MLVLIQHPCWWQLNPLNGNLLSNVNHLLSGLFPLSARPLAHQSINHRDPSPALAGSLESEKAKEGEGPLEAMVYARPGSQAESMLSNPMEAGR